MVGDTGINAWILNIGGAKNAPIVAADLTILAAMLHAVFAVLQKGQHDPWLSRGAIDFSYMMMALPYAFLYCLGPKRNYGPFSPVLLLFT